MSEYVQTKTRLEVVLPEREHPEVETRREREMQARLAQSLEAAREAFTEAAVVSGQAPVGSDTITTADLVDQLRRAGVIPPPASPPPLDLVDWTRPAIRVRDDVT